MIGFKDHALTDVVKGFDDIRDAVRGIDEMSKKLDTFMQQHRDEIRSMQQFNRAMMTEMKTLVEHIVGERTTTVILRVLSHDQARQEMLDLYRSNEGPLFYSDIAERLQMDLEQVLKVATELEQERLIGEIGKHGQAFQAEGEGRLGGGIDVP